MNDFGEYLKEIRGKRSLRKVEELTGISHTYLSTLEKGFDPRSKKPRKPTPEVIKQISEGLNVDYYEMMNKAGYLDDRHVNEIIRDVEATNKDTWPKDSYILNFEVPKKEVIYNANGTEITFGKELSYEEARARFLSVESFFNLKESITLEKKKLNYREKQLAINLLKYHLLSDN